MARFRLPGGSTLHEIAGRVVWNHRKSDRPEQTPGMGISFTDPASGAVLVVATAAVPATVAALLPGAATLDAGASTALASK